VTLEPTTGVVDRDVPLPSRLGGHGVFELQEMLDQALDLAEEGVPLDLAQIVYLLGQVSKVDGAVLALRRGSAQRRSAALRRGIDVLLAEFLACVAMANHPPRHST
jgi:hypothetical protein